MRTLSRSPAAGRLLLAVLPALLPFSLYADDGPDVDDDGDGFTEDEGDCNDAVFAINPAAPEVDDDIDNNCNGFVDESSAIVLPRAAIVLVGFEVTTKFYKVHYTQSAAANTFAPSELEAYRPDIFPNIHTFAGWVGFPANCGAATLTDPAPATGVLYPQCSAEKLVDFSYTSAGSGVLDNNLRSVGGGFSTASPIAGIVVYDNDCTTAVPPASIELWISNNNAAWTKVASPEVYVLNCGDPLPNPESASDDDEDGYSENEGDCNDADPGRYPGAIEVDDDVDNDCDLRVDNHLDSYDDDGDGVSEDGGDCDDDDPARYPAAAEVKDGIDNNCDGRIDERTTTHAVETGGSIQDAIATAGPYDRIVVGPGVYTGPLDFQGKDLEIVSEDGPESTFIEPGESCVSFSGGETSFAVLEGFTIREGSTSGICINDASPTIREVMVRRCGSPGQNGGGVSILGASSRPSFHACGFFDNEGAEGGGIFLGEGAGAFLDAVSFVGNIAAARGAGICLSPNATVTAQGSTWQDGQATGDGGAIFLSPGAVFDAAGSSIHGNVTQARGGAACVAGGAVFEFAGGDLSDNLSSGDGGALFLDKSGGAVLTDVRILRNITQARGGAACISPGSSWSQTGGVVEDNSSSGDGGGIFAASDLPGWSISSVGFSRNKAGGRGGALCVGPRNTVTLTGCILRGNTAAGDGGAIFLDEDNVLNLSRVDFLENTGVRGGGICSGPGGRILGSIGSFRDNIASGDGGGLFTDLDNEVDLQAFENTGNRGGIGGFARLGDGCRCKWRGSLFQDNRGTGAGGAIYIGAGTLDLEDGVFLDNVAGEGRPGGAVCLHNRSKGSFIRTRFERNLANRGGAVYVLNESRLTLDDCDFFDNEAYENGGALACRNYTGLSATNVRFERNRAGGAGAAVFGEDYFFDAPHRFDRCRFVDGLAGGDGGALAYIRVPVQLVDSDWIDNRAGGHGGHLCLHHLAHTAIQGCRFVGGRANGNGGAIFREDAQLACHRSVFHSNIAEGAGGGICAERDYPLELTNSTLVNNRATRGGGIHGGPGFTELTLVNDIIAFQQAGGGVVLDEAPVDARIAYNDVFGNLDVNFGGTLAGANDPTGSGGNIAVDPLFVAYSGDPETDDLRLRPESPARDTGDPAVVDPDSSRSDMGAFGGPEAEPALEDGDVDQDGYTVLEGDCDDEDAAVNPGATETGGNYVDEDCDDLALDIDGDGEASTEDGGEDCDDLSAEVNPQAAEVPGNLVDEDCDGIVQDRDNDGYSEAQADCADTDPSRYPGATEVPDDGIDQDCDGEDLETGGGDDDDTSGDDDDATNGDDDDATGDDDDATGDDDDATTGDDDDATTGDDDDATGDDDDATTGDDDDATTGDDDDATTGDDDDATGDDDDATTGDDDDATGDDDSSTPGMVVGGGSCSCDTGLSSRNRGSPLPPAALALIALGWLRRRR